MRVLCLLFSTEQTSSINKMAEACYAWSPQLAMSPEAIFIEVGRCRQLYHEDDLIKELSTLAQTFNAPFRYAFGADIPASLALARYQVQNKGQLPIEALEDFLNPFHNDNSCQRLTAALKKLGLKTLSSFAHLPAKALPMRFGKVGLLLRQRMMDASHLPWPQFQPPEILSETHEFDFTDRVESLEPLLFVIKKLVDRSLARLRGRAHKLSALQLTLALDSSEESRRQWDVDFPLPQSEAKNVSDILRDRLSGELQKKPLTASVEKVTLEVTASVPGQYAQKDFFSRKEEEVEAWMSLVARLNEKTKSVFQAQPVESHRPESTWAPVLNMESLPTQVSTPPRPLRLLKRPTPLIYNGDVFVHCGHQLRVVDMTGPERLSGEWWGHEYERDYFEVTTQNGPRLWVFKKPHTNHFYLHGYFD